MRAGSVAQLRVSGVSVAVSVACRPRLRSKPAHAAAARAPRGFARDDARDHARDGRGDHRALGLVPGAPRLEIDREHALERLPASVERELGLIVLAARLAELGIVDPGDQALRGESRWRAIDRAG